MKAEVPWADVEVGEQIETPDERTFRVTKPLINGAVWLVPCSSTTGLNLPGSIPIQVRPKRSTVLALRETKPKFGQPTRAPDVGTSVDPGPPADIDFIGGADYQAERAAEKMVLAVTAGGEPTGEASRNLDDGVEGPAAELIKSGLGAELIEEARTGHDGSVAYRVPRELSMLALASHLFLMHYQLPDIGLGREAMSEVHKTAHANGAGVPHEHVNREELDNAS